MTIDLTGRAMDRSGLIDTTFDFRSDTPPGKDADALSPTLHRYHRLLWSKPLPGGFLFELTDRRPRGYLYHRSELGEFWLSSDTVIPTFVKEPGLANVFTELSAGELEAFGRIGYTMGGTMIFPGNMIDGQMTINQQRGCHWRIKDRFDLTVECIRRHYLGEESPLRVTLERYAEFFSLFGDFRGYSEFFLLQDLVTEDGSAVRFFTPFDDFQSSPVPSSLAAYRGYRDLAVQFIEARNRRIATWWAGNPGARPAS
jgi:hypothetical protein